MNSRSGGRHGSRGRRGIGPGRSPNMRVWWARLPAAPSRISERRNGRGSIGRNMAPARKSREDPHGSSSSSGDRELAVKAGITPDLCADALGEYVGSIPDICESKVKRSEAEAHDVRRPKIADDAALDHCLHNRIALVEGDRYLAAAQRRLARGHDIHVRQQRGDAGDEKLGKRETLLPQRCQFDAFQGVESHINAAQRNDRLSAAEKALDAGVGLKIAIEGKRRRMSPPARQGMPCGGVMVSRDVDKRRRSRTSVQIFVRASDREIDGMAIECKLDYAGGMTDIPHRQRACIVYPFGDGADV